jgi:hypothetical protein
MLNELQNSSSASKEVSQSPAKGPNAEDHTKVECGDRCPMPMRVLLVYSLQIKDYTTILV